LAAEELGEERDFGVVLDDFHALKGGEEIGAEGNDAVIGHEDGFVIGGEGFEDVGQIGRAGSGVGGDGNRAESGDAFGEERAVKTDAGGGEASGDGRMRVADGVHVGAALINHEVHGEFGGGLLRALELASGEIGDDEAGGIEAAFAGAGGSGEDAGGVQADGEVAVGGRDKAAFAEPAARDANFMTM